MKFNGSVENVKYFGIEYGSSNRLKENVEVLFYNDISDFAVKLKTKENEEIILYLNNSNLSFNDLYNEINKKTKLYNGNKNLLEDESLRIPYIYVNTTINYSELCNKEIKFTNGMHISNAVQNVIFSLNEIGGNLISEGVIKDQAQGISESIRHFVYTKPFVIFLKETDKELPYFALKVDNTDILVQGN